MKNEMKQIEITDFSLDYDGMYFILWKEKRLRVYLPLDIILKMLAIEGHTNEEVAFFKKSWEPIPFKKVTLVFKGYEKNGKLTLLTSDYSECYFDKKRLTLFDVKLK